MATDFSMAYNDSALLTGALITNLIDPKPSYWQMVSPVEGKMPALLWRKGAVQLNNTQL